MGLLSQRRWCVVWSLGPSCLRGKRARVDGGVASPALAPIRWGWRKVAAEKKVNVALPELALGKREALAKCKEQGGKIVERGLCK